MENYLENETKFRERLGEALRKNGIDTSMRGIVIKLASLFETSEFTIRRWLNHDNPKLPNTPALMFIAKKLGVSIDFLLGMDTKNDCGKNEMEKTHTKIRLFSVQDRKFETLGDSYIGKNFIFESSNKQNIAFKVDDDAVSPSLVIGDVATFCPVKRIADNRIYAIYNDDKIIYRRIILTSTGAIKVIADNSNYPSETYQKYEYKIWEDYSKLDVFEEDVKILIVGRLVNMMRSYI